MSTPKSDKVLVLSLEQATQNLSPKKLDSRIVAKEGEELEVRE